MAYENLVDFKDRFRHALDVRNMKQVELCEKTGLSKGAVSGYLSGYAKPKRDKLGLIAKALNVDEAWLLGFDVPMDKEKLNIDIEKSSFNERKEMLTSIELNVLSNYSKLTDDQKKIIESTMNAFIDSNKK